MENLGALYSHITYVLLYFACGFKYFTAYKFMSLKSWCSNKKNYVTGLVGATAAFADHRIKRHGFDLRLNQSCCIALDKLLRCDHSVLQFAGYKYGVQPRSDEVLQSCE